MLNKCIKSKELKKLIENPGVKILSVVTIRFLLAYLLLLSQKIKAHTLS